MRVPLPAYNALLRVLSGRFTILTTGIIMPIEQQTIDHVAVSAGLQAPWVQSISPVGPDGRTLSDHFGIAADITPTL